MVQNVDSVGPLFRKSSNLSGLTAQVEILNLSLTGPLSWYSPDLCGQLWVQMTVYCLVHCLSMVDHWPLFLKNSQRPLWSHEMVLNATGCLDHNVPASLGWSLSM